MQAPSMQPPVPNVAPPSQKPMLTRSNWPQRDRLATACLFLVEVPIVALPVVARPPDRATVRRPWHNGVASHNGAASSFVMTGTRVALRLSVEHFVFTF